MRAGWYRQHGKWLLYLWRGRRRVRLLTLVRVSDKPDETHMIRGEL